VDEIGFSISFLVAAFNLREKVSLLSSSLLLELVKLIIEDLETTLKTDFEADLEVGGILN